MLLTKIQTQYPAPEPNSSRRASLRGKARDEDLPAMHGRARFAGVDEEDGREGQLVGRGHHVSEDA